MSVSDADAIVVVQIDFDPIGWIAEAKNGNFRVDQEKSFERTWKKKKWNIALLS